NPDQPKYLSKFDHASSCDPVYVVGNTAYVTLRSGTRCQGFTNQLDILDVSDLRSPSQISTFAMDNPHGLSIVDKTMYLCEGIYGLKVYDVTDNKKIELKSQIKNHHAFDVIALDSNLLMMIGDDGFYQYDISDPLQLKELSRIEVQR
ncbi:MAG: hypothetical protein ABIV51_08660, partial [Saprospiraceae bacterium]